MNMEDNFKHQGRRLQLVALLREMGIVNEEVLKAIASIPRHFFLDKAFETYAYQNVAFKIGAGQTISQPYTVAFQTSLIMPLKGLKVLEIGTGSGYQSAVLCNLGSKVFTIERQRVLFDRTRLFLPQQLGYSPRFSHGDGYKGWPVFAPFDRIIVTAGAPEIPEDLKLQMKVGGKMVIPVGDLQQQVMKSLVRLSENEWKEEVHGDFKFVPMLQEKEWK
jgi:protein-L-isoaspartate(D-aspartate) O-methyltransferase